MKGMNRVEKVDAESQAIVYAQQVATGTKSAASFMVKQHLVSVVEKAVLAEGCHSMVEDGEEWATVWVYKYPFVKLLIEEKRARNGHGRPSPLDIWSAGKLFGYSDYEIARYLEQKGYISSALTSLASELGKGRIQGRLMLDNITRMGYCGITMGVGGVEPPGDGV